MTKKDFLSKHPLYARFHDEWLFHIRSYLGGSFYRDGGYLLQHPFESPDNYARRKETACYYNYCAPIIDILTAYLYWKSPQRSYGGLSPAVVPPRRPETLFDTFWWNADYEGSSFDQFMRNLARKAGIYGRVSVLVDKPRTPALTEAQAKEMDIRPYLTLITPENLLDWSYARVYGRLVLDRVKIAEEWDADGKEPVLVREWTRAEWRLWKLSGDEKEATLVEEGVNPLDEVPLVNLHNKLSGIRMIGVSDLQDIAGINRDIYSTCSAAKEIIENTAFPMLAMPYDKTGASEQEPVGPKNIMQFDPEQPNSRPFWLEAPHSSLAEIRQWIEQDTLEMARIAKMGGLRNTETSTQPWTGVAIRTQMEQLKSSLVEKADNAEQAELDILRLWARWQEKDFEGTVDYQKDFDIEDLTSALDNAIKAVNGKVKSITFEKKRQQKVVSATLPSLDEAERDRIFKEIDENVTEAGADERNQVYEYHLKVKDGLVKKNELRQRMGLPPLPAGGDDFVEINDATAGDGGEGGQG